MDDQMLHHFMEDLLPIVVFPTLTLACAWVLIKIIAAFRHRANLRAQTDFHNRMMEKFSSADDFTVYLQSEAGRNFFENLGSEPTTPMTRIIISIQRGVILTMVGLGFFLTRFVIGTADSYSIMIIVSTILMTVGIGFLISSGISYWLAKTWGLITTQKNQVSNQTAADTI